MTSIEPASLLPVPVTGMSATTVLVTGATGTVGSRLLNVLASSTTCAVRAATRRPDDMVTAPGAAVTPVLFDWNDSDVIAAAVEGVDKVFLLAPLMPDHVESSSRLIDASVAAGVQQVVKLSTLGADAKLSTVFGRWHLAVEQLLEASGMGYTMLRPGSFMDNFVTFFRPDGNGMMFLPFGDGAASYIDARDIADVAAHVLASPDATHLGRVYELTGPEALTAAQVAAALTDATSCPIQYVPVEASEARAAMLAMDIPSWLVEGLLELYALIRDGYTAATTDTVANLAGHPPRTFGQFAADHKASWQ